MSKTAKVLVFFSYRNHKHGYIEMLFKRLQERSNRNLKLELHRGTLSDMHIQIKDNKLSIIESLTGCDLRDFDLIYFELWYKAGEQALAAALYAQRYHIPFFSRGVLNITPVTKVGELAVLADHGVSLPTTFITSHRELKEIFKSDPPVSYPLIVKAADGFGGNNNFLVASYLELRSILQKHPELQFIVQEYIPNECDYRCLVMGGRIVLVVRRARRASTGSHLNNTSKGAVGEIVPQTVLPTEVRRNVVKSAKILKREEFSGVDLMLHGETGQPYVLEVNPAPQIEIGVATDQKMDALLKYMETRVKENTR